MYLDCHTAPPLFSRYCGNPALTAAIARALSLLEDQTTEGVIVIYDDHQKHGFRGCAIKLPHRGAYFEPAENLADGVHLPFA